MQFCYTFSTIFYVNCIFTSKIYKFQRAIGHINLVFYSIVLSTTYYLVCICAMGKHLLTAQDFNILD